MEIIKRLQSQMRSEVVHNRSMYRKRKLSLHLDTINFDPIIIYFTRQLAT